MYNIGNCGNNWKLLYIEEIGNWKQFPVSFFFKKILDKFWAARVRLCWRAAFPIFDSSAIFWQEIFGKCQIMEIPIIWKIVKYLSMTRVALLSIFPVFYIISNLCLYIKMYKYSLKNFKKSIDLLLIFMYNNICKVVETQKT